MRAWEFINEEIEVVRTDVADALPATYAIPELTNQDPYRQYRFGMAIANNRGKAERENDSTDRFSKETAWGENQIIVSYGEELDGIIDDALKVIGLSGKKMISTKDSTETPDVGKQSPINSFKGFTK